MHARNARTGGNFSSKTAIKRALEMAHDNYDPVTWIEIGTPLTGFRDRYWTSSELTKELDREKISVLVVGPDPHWDRRYFGTVKVRAGKLVVS